MPFIHQAPTQYDSAEWTQAIATNYDVSQQALFVNCLNPTHVVIRVDADVTAKFNDINNPVITIKANTAFEWTFQFHSLFITTTGSTSVKILFDQRDIA